jgi:hypothetical protein
LWSDSADRGLYKTTDAGKTWTLILKGPNLSTGCSGLTMDPSNPERLLVGTWDFRRKGWTFRSGGEGPEKASGSNLYVTENGGASFSELGKQATGLPKGPWGRVEVEYAPSDAKIVYAFIEGVDSALFRSADGGKTWEQRDKSQMMVWRPFYFANLVIDPSNPDRIFADDLLQLRELRYLDQSAKFDTEDDGGLGGEAGREHTDKSVLSVAQCDLSGLWTAGQQLVDSSYPGSVVITAGRICMAMVSGSSVVPSVNVNKAKTEAGAGATGIRRSIRIIIRAHLEPGDDAMTRSGNNRSNRVASP